MSLVWAGVVLAVVGLVLAVNLGGIADKGARLNARLGGLSVNSQPNSWRLTGAIFMACGVPLAVWAAMQPR